MKYSRQELLSENRVWQRDDFVFFWKPCKDGVLDKGCFSQWYMSPFVIDGLKYNCAEQYMMAMKANLFGDDEICKEIIGETSPKRIRELGRLVRNFDGAVWGEHKAEFVRQANFAKFTQCEELRKFICSTEGKILVEASPFDRIWGIGMGEHNEKCVNPATWRGSNLLGFTLMEVRDRILAAES